MHCCCKGHRARVGYGLMQGRSVPITGALWLALEWWLLAGCVPLAALVPVLQAYRLNVLQQLQR